MAVKKPIQLLLQVPRVVSWKINFTKKSNSWRLKNLLTHGNVTNLIGDSVDGESSLNIINETEIFPGFIDLDDIHETSRITSISSGLAVDLDQPLLHDGFDLFLGQSILEPISQENGDRHTFAQTMRSRAGTTRVNTSQLVQHPWFWCCQTLQMFLWPSTHGESAIWIFKWL